MLFERLTFWKINRFEPTNVRLKYSCKTTSEIKEIVTKDIKTEEIKDSKSTKCRHDYLLYVDSVITIVYLFLFIISCIEQIPWYTINRPGRSKRVIQPNPATELGQYQIPVQTEEPNQSEPTDYDPATIHLQNQK